MISTPFRGFSFHKSKSRRWLTLVEIIVVVGVIGVVMGFAISTLKGMIRPSATGAAEKFQKALQFCYKNAIIHNSAVMLRVDLENNTYTAFRLVRTESGLVEKKILAAKLSNFSRIMDIEDIRGIKQESGIVNIPFTYTGISEDYNIHFGNEDEIVKTVINFRYNGRTLVRDGEVHRTVEENNEKNSVFEDEKNRN